MQSLIEFAKHTIEAYGYMGIFLLTAAEQFIFPIPADIFVVLGVSNGLLFGKVLQIVLLAALVGALIGYFLGKYLGHPIVVWLFGKKKLEESEKFIKKWGILGVVLAGLTPIPFKLVTWSAGIFEMPLHRFLIGVVLGRMPRYILTAYAGTLFFQSKFYATTEMSAIILGSVQGLTEFLPISSSGHLVIMEHFLYVPIGAEQLIMFDIFLHGGSLLAILLYFWKDWWQVLKDIGGFFQKRKIDHDSLAFKLALGTIPAIIAGLALGDAITGPLRNLHWVAFFFILVSLLFFYTAWKGRNNHGKKVSLKKAVLIGCAQAFALIPGVSRSGSTIAVGVLLGLKRDVAARFSFMLGGVAILAANVYALFSVRQGAIMPDLTFTMIGFFSAFVVSLGTIFMFLKFLEKYTLRPFAIYLLLAGIFILSFL